MGNCTKSSQQKLYEPKKISQIKLQSGLNLIIRCWKQTHNNLFNFNLPDHKLNIQTINNLLKKVRIVKLADQYQVLLQNDTEFNNIMPPVMIDVCQLKQKYNKQKQKKYTFLFNQFPKISKPFWIVLKSLPLKRYLLKQGDIFKMGKIKLRVKQIVYTTTQTRDLNKNIQNQLEFKVYDCETNYCEGVLDQNDDYRCRICMEPGQRMNPLIGLCDCSGTSKYTHFNCLRQWFTTQLNATKINMVTQVNWKSLACEFCMTKLPYSIILDQQTYYLVQFPKMKKPYLVLNPVYKQNNQKSKIYYFISFKKNNRMTLGRKADSDIQICSDATMSRNHAVLQYAQTSLSNMNNQNSQKEKFYLYDNKSKFGTVVLLNTKNQLIVQQKMNGVQFQVGGDLITICFNKNPILNNKTNQPAPRLITQPKQDIDFNIDRSNINQLLQFNQQQQQQPVKQIDNNTQQNQNVSVIFQSENVISNNKMLIK